MKDKYKVITGFFVGGIIGATVGFSYVMDLRVKGAFDRGVSAGREVGRSECAKPSRLERAAEWLSK